MTICKRSRAKHGARFLVRRFAGAVMLCGLLGGPLTMDAAASGSAAALLSPWDLHPVKATNGKYSCPTVATLPHDVDAFDYYSDARHSVIDPKRYAAYTAIKAKYTGVTGAAERAADHFQETGNTAAAACVMTILLQQSQADAMTGSMSSNQANYVQNWTLGALAITYLKVRLAGPEALGATPAQIAAAQAWMQKVGGQVETYFAARRAKGTTDGSNNHLYWAGFAAMSAGIATNDRSLYDWGYSTYKDGVEEIADDGTLAAGGRPRPARPALPPLRARSAGDHGGVGSG